MRSEKTNTHNNIAKVRWVIINAFRNCFWSIMVYIVILLLTTVLKLFVSVANKEIINQLTKDMKTGLLSHTFVGVLILFLILYSIEKTGGFLRAYGTNFFRFQVDGFFRKMFMWKCNKLPQECFFKTEFMDQFTLVSQHISSISAYIGSVCELLFSDVAYVVGMLVLFAIYEPYLIPYACLNAIFSFYLNKYISKYEYELDKKQIRNKRKESYISDLLTGHRAAKEIRIYQLSGYLMEKWRKVYRMLRQERLDINIMRAKLWSRQERFLLYIRVPAVLLLLGGALRGRYDIGTFIMLFEVIKTCGTRMNSLAYNMVQGIYKDTKYIQDYYDFIYPITELEIQTLIQNLTSERKLAYGKFTMLEMREVSYAYPMAERKAIESVSFVIRRGEIVSVLGYNGSGKTTLAKLMNGSLKPQAGEILMNGRFVSGENMGPYFGNLPQEYSKFSIPLREHVGIGRIEMMEQEDELQKAYQKAGVDKLILGCQKDKIVLGKEYEEDGIELSGGEWQRVSLASAHMGNPEILLLDEPSASIDTLHENAFLKNIREQVKGRTAILISHRIAFARLADRIVMMKDGKIVEEGNHDELLSKKGYYYEFFKKQKELYQEE